VKKSILKFLGYLCGLIFLCSTPLHAIVPPKTIQEMGREQLLFLLSGEWVSRALYVATRLEVADHLCQGPKSLEELARVTQSHPESLCRLLRMLAEFQVFQEVAPCVFANTEMSSLLAKSHPETLHCLSLFYGEDMHKAWEELFGSVQTGKPAFDLIFKESVFNYFKANPVRAQLFQQAMKEKSMAVIHSALSSYDFGAAGQLFDIGGGYGQFMEALIQKYPSLQGTLLELPEVVQTIRKSRPDLEKRCTLIPGDFFESIPKRGKLYLLKSVLHDWDDEKCLKILRNCHGAMEGGSKLLILEVVLTPTGHSSYASCMDLLMMAVTGGKERSLEAFQQMLESSGFVLEHIYPTSTEFSILEARKK